MTWFLFYFQVPNVKLQIPLEDAGTIRTTSCLHQARLLGSNNLLQKGMFEPSLISRLNNINKKNNSLIVHGSVLKTDYLTVKDRKRLDNK